MENNQQEKISLWNKIKIGFATLLIFFIIVLIFQNWITVPLNLILKTFNTPLAVLIVISLVTGYFWGTISAYRKYSKTERKNRSQNNIPE